MVSTKFFTTTSIKTPAQNYQLKLYLPASFSVKTHNRYELCTKETDRCRVCSISFIH